MSWTPIQMFRFAIILLCSVSLVGAIVLAAVLQDTNVFLSTTGGIVGVFVLSSLFGVWWDWDDTAEEKPAISADDLAGKLTEALAKNTPIGDAVQALSVRDYQRIREALKQVIEANQAPKE